MKKFAKLSLVASLALSSSAFADSLEEAFKASKVSGEIKAQYFKKNGVGVSESDSIFVVGGNLGVVTGSYYGVKAGFTFQTSHVPSLNDDDNSGSFTHTMDAQGAVLSESYLAYTMKNTTLKVGRQYIGTPLVAGSGSRMIKQSFEGAVITNTDIANTTFTAAYVGKYQNRTDGAGSPGEFEKYEDGAYTLYVKNTSVANLTLQAQYLDVQGIVSGTDKNALYMQTDYKVEKIATVSAQYFDTSNGSVDGSLFGLKANGNIGPVNVTVAYTTTGSEGTVFSGVGSAADKSFTALPVGGGGPTYTKDTDTIVGALATTVAGVTGVIYAGHIDNNTPQDIDGYGGMLMYSYNKNFSTKVMYENVKVGTVSKASDTFRLYLSYKF